MCHGPGAVAAGGTPDLRASAVVLNLEATSDIIIAGQRVLRGMPQFDEMDKPQVEAIQHYIRDRARKDLQKKQIVDAE
jgi:quinohemoprotein ethanol dehydrogenase